MKKMALVPFTMVEHLMRAQREQQQLITNSPIVQLSTLDQDMKAILDSNEPADIKAKRYSQVMQTYSAIRDKEVNKHNYINARAIKSAHEEPEPEKVNIEKVSDEEFEDALETSTPDTIARAKKLRRRSSAFRRLDTPGTSKRPALSLWEEDQIVDESDLEEPPQKVSRPKRIRKEPERWQPL